MYRKGINMKAEKLYNKLNNDFITDNMTDEWFKYMGEVEEFICDNFKSRSMGLVCDFTNEIKEVYCAVFPTFEVMKTIIDEGVMDAMLFVHHPSNWDIRKAPKVFYQMDKEQLKIFKERRISIYNLHVPLDNYGTYSTSNTLAEVLGIKVEEPFALYNGAQNGVIGTTSFKDITALKRNVSKVLGHDVVLYQYGDDIITDSRVAIIAGGGNDIKFVSEAIDKGVKVFITGITNSKHYLEVHEYEKKNKINVIGGTHYSTEKFACIKMCEYFKKLGIESKFINGVPIFEDM